MREINKNGEIVITTPRHDWTYDMIGLSLCCAAMMTLPWVAMYFAIKGGL